MAARTRRIANLTRVLMLASLPLVMGAEGDCGNVNSQAPAPDVEGAWDIQYDDQLTVEVKLGGAVYEDSIGVAGGVVSIDHDGQPFEFDLDCQREDVVCPSEVWPMVVDIDQRNPNFPSRMWVTLPKHTCTGETVAPPAGECGDGTDNPDCEMVCDGEILVEERDVFGVIGEGGDSFRLSLGGGIATNGVNCVLLGLSFADADLVNVGSADTGDWESVEMASGLVTTGYSGSCLWLGNVDADADVEALALGAEVTFTTGFTGEKQL